MMRKVQRPWDEIKTELNQALSSCGLQATDINRETGVNYHAARRFLRNGVQNRTENTSKLCIFFKIETQLELKLQKPRGNAIVEAIEEAWDGSNAHASLIVELIRSTKKFTVQKSEDS